MPDWPSVVLKDSVAPCPIKDHLPAQGALSSALKECFWKCCRGIPAYVPLDMQPSRSAATNRSRLALQPVRHEPPAGQNETQADPIIDSGFDGMSALHRLYISSVW